MVILELTSVSVSVVLNSKQLLIENIHRENFQKVPKRVKLEIIHLATVHIAFTLYKHTQLEMI